MIHFDDDIPQALTWRNIDFVGFVAILELAGAEFVEALHAGLALGLPALGVAAGPLQFGLDSALVGGLLFFLGGQALFLGFQPV